MDQQPDAALVAAALQGETEPFCALVRRYQDHAYGVAVGVLADFDLALDAAQEAFLCAYSRLDKLKDPQRFGAWLCAIARNTSLEILRQRRRQESLAVKAADLAAGRQETSAGEVVQQNEERFLVRQALLSVGPADREALTLYYADGLSYGEICEFTGISHGTLKGRLQRGRAALRKELTMVERACKDNAPDESFARRLEQAIRVFGAKGPAVNHLPSAWHAAVRDEERRLLSEGQAGFDIDMALSHSGNRRLRWRTVIHFGLRRDARSLLELERMLEDRSARVRRQATGWYAGRIHPGKSKITPCAVATPADHVSPGLDKLLERMADENFNVRLAAVRALSAYAKLAEPRVISALQSALADTKHKVRHAAARALGVACPGCGRTW